MEKMKYLNEKGEITTAVIPAVIAAVILGIVILGVSLHLSGKIDFFDFGFNKTNDRIEGFEILRYDITNDGLAYFNGEKFVEFVSEEVKFGDRVIKRAETLGEFLEYIASAEGVKFFYTSHTDNLRLDYEVVYVDSDEIHVRTRGYQPAVFRNDGTIGVVKNIPIRKDVGNFEHELEEQPWKFYIVIDDAILLGEEYKSSKFLEHLSAINEGYLQGREKCVYLFDSQGVSDCKYEFVSGELNYENKPTGIFLVEDTRGLPVRLYVEKEDLVIEDVDENRHFREMRSAAYKAIFSRKIEIMDKLYCPELLSEKYIVVDLAKENEGGECK